FAPSLTVVLVCSNIPVVDVVSNAGPSRHASRDANVAIRNQDEVETQMIEEGEKDQDNNVNENHNSPADMPDGADDPHDGIVDETNINPTTLDSNQCGSGLVTNENHEMVKESRRELFSLQKSYRRLATNPSPDDFVLMDNIRNQIRENLEKKALAKSPEKHERNVKDLSLIVKTAMASTKASQARIVTSYERKSRVNIRDADGSHGFLH
ncbi:unnamed protein product, partial [Didymodactylos carnosus]